MRQFPCIYRHFCNIFLFLFMFFTVVWEQILNDFCHFIFVLLRIILVNFTGDHEKNAYFMILDKVCYRYQMNLACWLFFFTTFCLSALTMTVGWWAKHALNWLASLLVFLHWPHEFYRFVRTLTGLLHLFEKSSSSSSCNNFFFFIGSIYTYE